MKNGRDNKGKFTSGNKGRPKGSQNKETKELRERLSQLLDDNYSRFVTAFVELENEKMLRAYIDLLEYCTPKLNRTDLKSDGQPFIIMFKENDKKLL